MTSKLVFVESKLQTPIIYKMEALKIAQIEPIVVSQTLDEAFYFSQWEYQKRTICLVKVTTESGLVGWGEGYGPFGVVKAAIEFFTPL